MKFEFFCCPAFSVDFAPGMFENLKDMPALHLLQGEFHGFLFHGPGLKLGLGDLKMGAAAEDHPPFPGPLFPGRFAA